MPDYVIADCETDSLVEPYRPLGRSTWEIAALRIPEDGTPPSAVWLQLTDYDPTRPGANAQSLNIGRFAERFRPGQYGELGPTATVPGSDVPVHLTGVTNGQAAAIIEAFTAGRPVIAGSNPMFDIENFTQLLLDDERLVDDELAPWWHHPADVPNLAHGWLRSRYQIGAVGFGLDRLDSPDGKGWGAPTYSTRVISEAVGVPEPVDRHSAWADVVWMAQIDAAIGGPSARLFG